MRAGAADISAKFPRLPDSITPQVAQQNLKAIGSLAKAFLPLLFFLAEQTAAEKRGLLRRTLAHGSHDE